MAVQACMPSRQGQRQRMCHGSHCATDSHSGCVTDTVSGTGTGTASGSLRLRLRLRHWQLPVALPVHWQLKVGLPLAVARRCHRSANLNGSDGGGAAGDSPELASYHTVLLLVELLVQWESRNRHLQLEVEYQCCGP